jgi:DNA polymerase III subunit delta
MAASPPPDVLTLVITEKLDKKAGDAPWVRAIETHGVWIPVWPVEADALPEWLRTRARALQVTLTPAAAELIAARVEGNLLAARQELEKLALLAGAGAVDEALVLRAVADSARYDVFQLASAAAAGDAPRALQVLMGLKSEGVEPTLILWALTRELRGLWQARERERLHSNSRGSPWNLAAPPSAQAIARMRRLPLARLLVQASRADRTVKGQIRGDAWSAVTGLTAAFAGALQAGPESGRVAS